MTKGRQRPKGSKPHRARPVRFGKCGGKIAYPTKIAAMIVRTRIEGKPGYPDKMRVYAHEGHFHLTSTRTDKKDS